MNEGSSTMNGRIRAAFEQDSYDDDETWEHEVVKKRREILHEREVFDSCMIRWKMGLKSWIWLTAKVHACL
jgi:hypothetical protein